MSIRRVFSLKFVVFSLAPTVFLLFTAETMVRLKYFFAHSHDWRYLTTPFGKGSFGTAYEVPSFVKPAKDQMVFEWQKPCGNRMVFSTELQKEMPRTFDDNCFRGDPVSKRTEAGTEAGKEADEYRIVFLGGSTVEDAQSDSEMMTAQFKRAVSPAFHGKRVTVVNAGKAGFDSRRIQLYYESTVAAFSPDLVLYYEAWNEQPSDATFARVDQVLATLASRRLHHALYYRSLLYTYAVEKYEFSSNRRARFWKIDVNVLKDHFTQLARDVRRRGARFVFVTQVLQFPRMWKGVDTFEYRAVDALLDRLKADPQYVYDAREISALNQRLAVIYTLDLCHEHDIRIVNILEPVEALGDAGRAEMFMDLGHLTVKGDRIVSELLAARLNLSE